MSIDRDLLYSKFENFDKPNELDFRALIDGALSEIIFSELSVTPVSDLITDINTHAIPVKVREVYVVTYGVQTYLFTNVEGTYGLNGIPITSGMLVILPGSSGGSLATDLNPDVAIGKVKPGVIIPQGTSFDEMFRLMLKNLSVSNLQFIAGNQTTLREVGTDLIITGFTWDVEGGPTNLNLSDTAGQLNIPVTGTSVSVNETYTKTSPGDVVFTLQDLDLLSTVTTKEVEWVYPSYFDTVSTLIDPDETDIPNGIYILRDTATSIEVQFNADLNQGCWLAVPSNYSASFSKWEVSDLNKGDITSDGSGFVTRLADIQVGTVWYARYVTNYKSEVKTIKFY